jgi:hypothetical protein
MRLGEIVATMREIKKRKLIGRLAGKEVARQGAVEDAAKAARMSSSELHQVFNADWTVPGVKLRGVKKAPGLKDNLLCHILAGDSAGIVALSDAEVPSPLRCAILAALTPIAAEEEGIRARRRGGLV